MRKDILFTLAGACLVTVQVILVVVAKTARHNAGISRPSTELMAVVPGLGMGGVLRQQSLAEVNEAVSLSYTQNQGPCQLLGHQNAEFLDRQSVSSTIKLLEFQCVHDSASHALSRQPLQIHFVACID